MQRLKMGRLAFACAVMGLLPAPLAAQVGAIPPRKVAPSFDCAKARSGTIDQVICANRELSILDRTMGQDYARALSTLPSAAQDELRREQREFIANRNLCMKRKADLHDCITFAYESRIERLGEWADGGAGAGQ